MKHFLALQAQRGDRLSARSREIAATQQVGQSNSRSNPLYRQRRTGVLAVGVAVVVISGSILGAQLKSRNQAQERAALQHSIQSKDGLQPQQRKPSIQQTISIQAESENAAASVSAAPVNREQLQKQVAFLEERRASLMFQKTGLEKKLEDVRRKQKIAQETDARRKEVRVDR